MHGSMQCRKSNGLLQASEQGAPSHAGLELAQQGSSTAPRSSAAETTQMTQLPGEAGSASENEEYLMMGGTEEEPGGSAEAGQDDAGDMEDSFELQNALLSSFEGAVQMLCERLLCLARQECALYTPGLAR